MRQGQQNRRGRGRNNNNNNNRKGQNPLTRSFESNGPDIKIRGTPAHIAEKYLSLARDAQSSGDPVLAENYLQHAEHYNRIIMAYREQQIQQGGGDPMRHRPQFGEGAEGDALDDDGDDMSVDPGQQPQPAFADQPGGGQPAQQPMRSEGQRFEHRGDRNERHQRHQRDGRPHFRDRNGADRGGYQDRGDRGDRDRDRDRGEQRMERHDRPDRDRDRDRPERDRVERPSQPAQHQAEQPPMGGEPRRRERFVPQHEQPEFLRRPVRRPRREDDAETQPAPAGSDEPTRD